MTLNLNRMSSYWNRDERIKINNNWDKIEKSFNGVTQEFDNAVDEVTQEFDDVVREITQRFDNAVDEVTQKAYDEIIDTVRDLTKINWLAPVPTYDDIETTYPNPTLGDITITSDDGSVYRYDGEQWVFINKIDPDVYMKLQDDVTAIQNGLEETNNNLMQLQQDFMSHLADIAVNIKDFGAVGDGVTDDTQAILAARDYVLANGGILYIPENFNCLVTGSINLFGLKNIRIEGMITGSLATDELIIGFDSKHAVPTNYFINRVDVMKIKIQGLKNADVKINMANHVLLWADGDVTTITSIAYCRFNLGYIKKLEFNSQGTAIGWINENTFIKGRITELIMDGNYSHNHNVFYNPTFENTTIQIKKGISNVFYDCRLEGTNTITFDSGTYDNRIFRSWHSAPGVYLRQTATLNYTDNGKNNIFSNALDWAFNHRKIFELNNKSQNYNLSAITRNANDLTVAAWKIIWESDLIEIESDFGMHFKSDQALFRMYVYLYDADKNPIEVETPDAISSNHLIWSGTHYSTGSNLSTLHLAVFKNTNVKYVKVRIDSGSRSGTFKHAMLKLIELKGKEINVPVPRNYTNWNNDTAPSSGTWEVGDVVYKTNPVEAGAAGSKYVITGWVCTAAGSPGTWLEMRMLTGN